MSRAKESVEVLRGLVTQADMVTLFNCATLTITHWRDRYGMPYIRIPGNGKDTIRFRLKRVLRWARETQRAYNPQFAKRLRNLSEDLGDDEESQEREE